MWRRPAQALAAVWLRGGAGFGTAGLDAAGLGAADFGVCSVWSSSTAPAAFARTDSMPFSADALVSYCWLVAMISPFPACRLKWNFPLLDRMRTNFPVM